MKCPKCGLVTFDHLAKCPRCQKSFRLSRRLSRRGRDPNRKIVLRSADAPADPVAASDPAEPAPAASVPAEPASAARPAEPPPAATEHPVAPVDEAAKTPLAEAVAAALQDVPGPGESGTDASSQVALPSVSGETPSPGEVAPSTDDASPAPETGPDRPVRAASVEAIRQIAHVAPTSAAPDTPPEAEVTTQVVPVENAEAFLPPGSPKPEIAVDTTEARAANAAKPSEGLPAKADTESTDDDEAGPAAEGMTAHAADARQLKDRWKRSSQERRRERGDLMKETVDPDLPDWYSPVLEPEDDDADPGADSRPRKKRIGRRL